MRHPSGVLIGFILLFLIFTPLEHFFYLRRQKVFRTQWGWDVVHFFVNNALTNAAFLVMAFLAILVLKHWISPHFQSRVASQPAWLQFLEAVLLADITFYFAHRLAHQWPWLWKFHSIHHAIQEMDWLAAARLHPLDQSFSKFLVVIPLYVAGFSEATFGAYLGLAQIQAIFIHANLRFKFGPLRWLIATPEFHHWHHSLDFKASNSNFAGQFPWLDGLFGTLYLPGSMPEQYGISKPVPVSYWGQLTHPFRKTRNLQEE